MKVLKVTNLEKQNQSLELDNNELRKLNGSI